MSTVSRFTVSNAVVFLGQQYIVLWMPSLSSLLFFSLRPTILKPPRRFDPSICSSTNRNTGMITRTTQRPPLYNRTQTATATVTTSIEN